MSPTTTQTISPETAVKAALDYLVKVSPDSDRLSKFNVEEIKKDQERNYIITISYEIQGEFTFDRRREYKDFKIAKDGTVEEMTIRKI